MGSATSAETLQAHHLLMMRLTGVLCLRTLIPFLTSLNVNYEACLPRCFELVRGVQTWINRDSLQFSGDKHMIRETNDIKADLPPTAVINTPLGDNRSALIGCKI